MIKRFVFSLLLSVAIPIAAFPQVPQTMGYQGLLTDGSGVVVSDGSYSLTFKIYSVSTGGSALWTEVQGTVSTVNGVFNVILGSVTALNIAFDKTLYLEITVGSNVLSPRIELTGSPYAMNARGIVTSASGNVGIGTSIPTGKLQVKDGAVLFDGTTGAIPTTGAGTRMMWYPGKAAFRAGVVTSTQFDDSNIGVESTVSGGRNNIGSGEKSSIGGGVGNVASAIGTSIGGGNGNLTTDEYSTVGGGQSNQAGDNAGTTSDKTHATVGGGSGNTASGIQATIAGGLTNTASGDYTVVGGGQSNTAAQNQSTIAGGTTNNTSGGGINGTIGGGNNNTVSAGGATVGGGSTNTASGTNATVPGGNANTALGAYSFAAGRQAQANHNGTFVWADNQGTTFTSTGTDQFLIRAQGGVGIGTATPGQTLEVEVAGPAAIRVDNSSNSRATGLIAGVSGSALEFAVALFVQSNTYANVGTGVGTTRLYINGATGNVGIGTTTPGEILDVEASGATVAGFNRTTSDGTVISIQQAGVEEGTISVTTTTVSYNAFTGSHYAWTDTEIEKGVLVSLTGVNRGLHDDSESEVIYGITPTASVNDPRVMGSYLGLQESTQPMSVENPHLVMAVGNGAMWVVDNGRNIEIGDYLISSDVEGHAMVDPETFEVSHIVARVSEPIVWDEVAEEVEGRKHARITVFFESFTRNRKADRLENELVAVKARVDALEGMEGRLARLERMLATMMAEGKQSGQVSKYGE